LLKINSNETGVVFDNITFRELTDVPNDFTDLDKQILVIDELNNKLNTIEYKFIKLLDTPDEYNGK